MEAPVVRFAGLLRARGLRISPAETLDALAALRAMKLASRAAVRESLRATLVKEARDDAIFEETFETFFTPWLKSDRPWLGHGSDPKPVDIVRAARLSRDVTAAAAAVSAVAAVGVSLLRRLRRPASR